MLPQQIKISDVGLAPPTIAKITSPTASRLTERRRLFAALDQARRQGGVTWITAPPGFGKTSLATTYLTQSGCDTLWYRVDEEDADISQPCWFSMIIIKWRQRRRCTLSSRM